jgi:hypothetical protein
VPWSQTGIAAGVGSGPVYPILGRNTRLAVFERAGWGSWRGTKVLWFVHQRYRGNVLIRGRRLDGRHRLRFDGGAVPADELRIAAGPSPARWRDEPVSSRGRPSYIRVRAGGCYGVQIDGTTLQPHGRPPRRLRPLTEARKPRRDRRTRHRDGTHP